jgi:hypothetical protein
LTLVYGMGATYIQSRSCPLILSGNVDTPRSGLYWSIMWFSSKSSWQSKLSINRLGVVAQEVERPWVQTPVLPKKDNNHYMQCY